MKKEDFKYLGAIALVSLLFAVLLFSFAYWRSEVVCEAKWEGTYETQYSFSGGCRVKINGKWVPSSNVREF